MAKKTLTLIIFFIFFFSEKNLAQENDFYVENKSVKDKSPTYLLARNVEEDDLGYGTRSNSSRSRRKYSSTTRRSSPKGRRRPSNAYGDSRGSRQSRSAEGYRRPASFGLERQRLGVTKGFYGDNNANQLIGFNYGYCKDYIRDFGYAVIGNYNTYEGSVSAIRVDVYGSFTPNRRLALLGGLNLNQFMGKNMTNVQPGIGFQMGADIHFDGHWGIQIDYHNIKGSVSSGNGSASFEATGIELTAYINFF